MSGEMNGEQKFRLWLMAMACLTMIAFMIFGGGCTTLDWIKDHGGSAPNIPVPAVTNFIPPVVSPPAETNTLSDELDLSTVMWHGPDIRGWKVAADLVTGTRGGEIILKTDLLKGMEGQGDKDITGNAWAIVMCQDGKWHASTYEWINYGRQSRTLWKAFDSDHWTSSAIKGAKQDKGTEFYVAVSTMSRGNKRSKVDERTPFRKVVVP